MLTAYLEAKSNGPFVCPLGNDEVLLKTPRYRITHFAHANPIGCKSAIAESDDHRRCKIAIYEALQREPRAGNVTLKRSFEVVRPNVSADINDVPVAIDQLPFLGNNSGSDNRICAHKAISVIWLLQWRPELDSKRYASRIWEKVDPRNLHAAAPN